MYKYVPVCTSLWHASTQVTLSTYFYKDFTSLKNKPSCGTDGISLITIKENINVCAPLFCDIFNKSFKQGVVPGQFKTASVVPIFKAGDDALVSFYRPMSVINVIAKIFETYVNVLF